MANDFFEVVQEGALNEYQRHRSQARQAQIASAATLWADLLEGRVPSYYLQEALAPRTPGLARAIEGSYPGLFRENLTRSDFPYLTGDVLDRMMLGRYREFPAAWRTYAKVVNSLRDFRTVRRLAVDGAEGQLDEQGESEELSYTKLSETNFSYAPKKYSKGVKISFEALMNDDLGAFETAPDRLGRGAARTVAKFVTGLYVDASGPHASLYTAGNTNIVTGNPALSIAALGIAWKILRSMKDTDGEPIMVEAAVLTVPPALEVTAQNILNAVQVFLTNSGGASGQEMQVANWIGSSLSLAVDPYIPVVASTANGDTSWFLHAAPSVGRPALEVGFVQGFQEPALYQKQSNTIRVGGSVDQMAGDFNTMSQEYKAVTAFGGCRLEPKSTVGSNGSGS